MLTRLNTTANESRIETPLFLTHKNVLLNSFGIMNSLYVCIPIKFKVSLTYSIFCSPNRDKRIVITTVVLFCLVGWLLLFCFSFEQDLVQVIT